MKKGFISTKQNRDTKVIFCSRCVMSNQRPSSHPEHLKKKVSDMKYASFKKANSKNSFVCHACLYHEEKRKIDWNERKKEFNEIVKKIKKDRKKSDIFDCVVPGSGGKDSQWVALKLRENGLKPLCVTWAPAIFTNIGLKNLQLWQERFDHILFTPNREVHKKITKAATSEHRYPERLKSFSDNIQLSCGVYVFNVKTKLSKFYEINSTNSIHDVLII